MTAHAAIKNTFFEDFFVQKSLTIILPMIIPYQCFATTDSVIKNLSVWTAMTIWKFEKTTPICPVTADTWFISIISTMF